MHLSRGWKIVSTNLFRRVFVWVIKMLQYNRIDVSEGIDINKTGEYGVNDGLWIKKHYNIKCKSVDLGVFSGVLVGMMRFIG